MDFDYFLFVYLLSRKKRRERKKKMINTTSDACWYLQIKERIIGEYYSDEPPT
jgi:hypothetical protein